MMLHHNAAIERLKSIQKHQYAAANFYSIYSSHNAVLFHHFLQKDLNIWIKMWSIFQKKLANYKIYTSKGMNHD